MPDEADENALARDMIEVHGMEAPGVARANVRTAALAGKVASAKRWIRVLEVIQRRSIERLPGKIRQFDIPFGRRVKCGFPSHSAVTMALRNGPTLISGASTPRNRVPLFHAIAMPMSLPMLLPNGHADPGSYPEWGHRSKRRSVWTI